MRSDNLKKHMKIHDKHINLEPPPTISTTIPSTYTTLVYESSGYKLTNMDNIEELHIVSKCLSIKVYSLYCKLYCNGLYIYLNKLYTKCLYFIHSTKLI